MYSYNIWLSMMVSLTQHNVFKVHIHLVAWINTSLSLFNDTLSYRYATPYVFIHHFFGHWVVYTSELLWIMLMYMFIVKFYGFFRTYVCISLTTFSIRIARSYDNFVQHFEMNFQNVFQNSYTILLSHQNV